MKSWKAVRFGTPEEDAVSCGFRGMVINDSQRSYLGITSNEALRSHINAAFGDSYAW